MSSPQPYDPKSRTWIQVTREVADLVKGQVDLSDWDDEELMRGRKRSKRGGFQGRPTNVVPRQAYEEFVRRQLERVEQHLAANVAEATAELTKIAKDPDVPEAIRLKAIEMIHNRVLGTPKQRLDVDITGTLKHEQLIEDVTIRRDEWDEDSWDVVDAEVVEPDEPTLSEEFDEWDD